MASFTYFGELSVSVALNTTNPLPFFILYIGNVNASLKYVVTVFVNFLVLASYVLVDGIQVVAHAPISLNGNISISALDVEAPIL